LVEAAQVSIPAASTNFDFEEMTPYFLFKP
jgi:hypothetical protein